MADNKHADTPATSPNPIIIHALGAQDAAGGTDAAAGAVGAADASPPPAREAAAAAAAPPAEEEKKDTPLPEPSKGSASDNAAHAREDSERVVVHVRYASEEDEERPLAGAAGARLGDARLSNQSGDSFVLDVNEGAFASPGAPSRTSQVPGSAAGLPAPAPAHRAKSVSHWHDSRISVEMHLALYIEDLMMLAPGVAGEKAAAREAADLQPAGRKASDSVGDGSTVASAAGSSNSAAAAALPVDFDEDAEPDITLQHVLAGVEYLLHTRIIGSANPAAAQARIEEAEEEEDGLPSPAAEEKDASNEVDASAGLDANGLPVPLAQAPGATALSAAAAKGVEPDYLAPVDGSSSHPYFYFVSLDLALCDDLVTALCFHMRRAEQAWSLRPKASKEAVKALELFEGFFRYVYSFRCCVAARQVSYMRAALKVSRHLRSSDMKQRKLVVRLLLLLTHECPRIERWEDLVNADEQPKVREMLSSTEMKKLQRLLSGHRDARNYAREASLSHQASLKPSRNDSAGKESGAQAGSSSALVQSFPAFYSTRHHALLPPKGALYDVEPHRLLAMFRSNMEKGLHSDEIAERQRMYGMNQLPPPQQPSFLHLLLVQLSDFIIMVLIVAATVSLAIQDWESGGVLFFVVAVNVAIGLVQEYRSHNALKALNSFSIPQAQLLRDGVVSMQPASELVPGDIVILEEGANIPADLRLLQVSQLSTIEAILTGESVPVLKSTAAIRVRGRRVLPVGDRVNMAFMSTLVAKGRATALVVNTGATTEVGRIYSALSSSGSGSSTTPLQRKLARLGKWLVFVSILSCAAVIGIGLGRGYGTSIITIGIALAVSVIPEGLVTVVTLTMALGTQRMAKQKAIVRSLPAVETLGAVTTICSDKTGTLTEGKMKTEAMWVLAREANAQPASTSDGQLCAGHSLRFVTASKVQQAPKPPQPDADAGAVAAPSSSSTSVVVESGPSPVSLLLNESVTIHQSSQLPVSLQWNTMICCLNNNASVKLEDIVDQAGNHKTEEVMVGDATEVALLRAAQQARCPVAYWEHEFGLKRVLEFAFDSDRKRMSVILTLPQGDAPFLGVRRTPGATHMLLTKGAPEAVLNRSAAHLAAADGVHVVTPLDDFIESSIDAQGSKLASKGMRVLATAFRFLTAEQVAQFQADQVAANKAAEAASAAKTAAAAAGGDAAAAGADESPDLTIGDESCARAESDLCFIGLAGIMDPPRVEVADAISLADGAGIRVCMITGDHASTAKAIAEQIGIYREDRGDQCMNGDALAVLTEEQLANLAPFPVVFSRVSPENKLKLVKSLQKRGEITAMTGDGVNDSPAIRAADVGIAMGLGGTEVTRQSADIILSDDNFSTIVLSVGEGRRIYDNIVKFLVYLLTCNGAEVWVMLFAVALGMPVPFLSLMILWANIFVDIPPSLSLGLEAGEADAMCRPPRSAKQSILTLRDCLIIAFDSGFMAVMLLVNYWYSYEKLDHELEYARTYAFMLLASLHLMHSFQARSLLHSMFRRDIFSANPTLAFGIVMAIAFLILGCYLPGLNTVLELDPLGATEWGLVAINVCVHLLVMEARKAVMRWWVAHAAPQGRPPVMVPGLDGVNACKHDASCDQAEIEMAIKNQMHK